MLDSSPSVPGLTDNQSCRAYRETIFERADRETDDNLGAIWLDDVVGSLLRVLQETGQLEDTIILFFEDHGMEPKSSLYEGGVRIPMFINYGSKLATGSKLDVPVSTVDIGPTLLEYADITQSYEMDGKSLKTALAHVSHSNSNPFWIERCLFFELHYDRAVRCGCYKYLQINDRRNSNTWTNGGKAGLSTNRRNLFDLCNGSTEYSPTTDTEAVSIDDEQVAGRLNRMLTCHSNQVESQDYGVEYDCQLPLSSQPSPLPEPNHDDGQGHEVANTGETVLIVEPATVDNQAVAADVVEDGAPDQDSERTAEPSSDKPSASPSASPATSSPTTRPTENPTTGSPSSPRFTSSPSSSPVTTSPSLSPFTSSPSSSPSAKPTTLRPTSQPSRNPPAAPAAAPVAEEGASDQGSKWVLQFAEPSLPAASTSAAVAEDGAPDQDSEWTVEPSSPVAEEGDPDQDSEWTAWSPVAEDGASDQDFQPLPVRYPEEKDSAPPEIGDENGSVTFYSFHQGSIMTSSCLLALMYLYI